MNRTCVILLPILVLLSGSCLASDRGATGLSFLKIGAGARAAGMGEAYVAVSDDATAAFWNPAGLWDVRSTQVNFTHNQWFQDIRHEFLALGIPWGAQTVGISVAYNSIGQIEHRTGPTSEPIAMFSAHDLSAGLSYARFLTTRLAIGVTLKYIYEKIYTDTASGGAADIGVVFDPKAAGLSFGFAARNLGWMSKMREERIDLPRVIQAGLAWQKSLESFDSQVIAAGDLVSEDFKEVYFNLGIEGLFRRIVALRLGYQFGYDTKNISAGVGLRTGRYALDYAYVPYQEDLGSVQRFSIAIGL